MKITVFGGTGKVGTLVVKKLLDDGHQLSLLTHTAAQFDTNDSVRIVKGDVHDAAAVRQALTDSGAVISTLGSWHTPTKDILSSAMQAAIPAMQEQGITRLVSLTGSGAHAPGDIVTTADKISHALFGLVASRIIADAEEHLRLLSASDLDWTVLRAPVMRSGNASNYCLNRNLPKAWEVIERQAVAQAVVDQLDDTRYHRSAPHVHRS